MKKFLKFLSLILLICSIATLFAACNDNEEHKKITADYAKLYNTDEANVSFTCYAEFGGTHVLIYESRVYAQAFSNETVDEVTFVHTRNLTFDVYNGGNFYSLQEAFNMGHLTHENLVTLQNIYNPQ